MYLAYNDYAGAAAVLAEVAAATNTGGVPASATSSEPDAFAGLWFIRAAHLFAKAGGDPALVNDKLLPLTKKILQELISSAGIGGVRMDDGGLLIGPPELAYQTLRLNALWYSALETGAADFKVSRDPVADHFERLAGRFRRSFVKAYWCDTHSCICTPESRGVVAAASVAGNAGTGENASPIAAPPNSGGGTDHGDLPNAEQLLLTFLPASPIARTKQRQMLQMFRNKTLGSVGVLMQHPQHGLVESPLYRAWLVMGLLASADQMAIGMTDATAVAAALLPLRAQAHAGGIPAYYRDGQPMAGESGDLLTTAEVLGALQSVKLQ
jgi:hypothetical protein